MFLAGIHVTYWSNPDAHYSSDRWIPSIRSVNGASLHHFSGLRRNDGGVVLLFHRILLYRSCHHRFFSSIILTFHSLFQSLSLFSCLIADAIVSCDSYQTKQWTSCFFVNPSTTLFLCSHILLTRFEVTPMYNVPFGLLDKIYTAGFLVTYFNSFDTCPDTK